MIAHYLEYFFTSYHHLRHIELFFIFVIQLKAAMGGKKDMFEHINIEWDLIFVSHCLSFELPRGKINNVVSEQVRHKPTCTSTEAG